MENSPATPKSSNKIIMAIIVVILVGAAFFGGMQYGKTIRPSFAAGGNRQFAAGAAGTRGGQGGGMRGASGDSMVMGEVLKSDADGLTVKSPNNDGSKVIITSSSTQIMKTTTGTQDDVTVGSNVMIMGTANPDGSVTAKSIQLRPKMEVKP